VLAKEEERGKKKGVGGVGDTFYRHGGRQGKERGGGSGVEFAWKRETGGERGGLAQRSATGLWPTSGARTRGMGPSMGGRALTSGPRVLYRRVKFNSNSNSN
jgi:hypothetical protein